MMIFLENGALLSLSALLSYPKRKIGNNFAKLGKGEKSTEPTASTSLFFSAYGKKVLYLKNLAVFYVSSDTLFNTSNRS